MKTSTLRKLPIPFVVACVLGIGVIGFLIASPAQQEAAQNGVTPTVINSRLPANSPRYRSKNGVAKLNRSGGVKSGGVKRQASKQPGAEAQAGQAPSSHWERSRQQVARLKAERKETELEETELEETELEETELEETELEQAERSAQVDRQASLPQAARKEVAIREVARNEAPRRDATGGADGHREQAEGNETTRVAESLKPFRRDAEQVKSATVASTNESTSSNVYSPENPDPSEVLSLALSNVPNTTSQLEVDKANTETTPGFEWNEVELVAPKTDPAEMPVNAGFSNEVDETKAVATEESTEASSFVGGEPKSGTVPQLVEATPKRVVRIINPLSNSLPVWFVTQKHKVKLEPGQHYETSTDEELLIRFSRGGNLGVDRVVANDGDWVFSVTRQEGWELSQE